MDVTTTSSLPPGPDSGRADLLDLDGNVVHSWTSVPCRKWMHADLLENGDLLIPGSNAPAGEGPALIQRYLLRLDWQGNTVPW